MSSNNSDYKDAPASLMIATVKPIEPLILSHHEEEVNV